MKLLETQALAEKLIVEHLPNSEWSFKWNNRLRSLGLCSYRAKTIFLSARWLSALPDSEIVDTILHEIAHAIAGHKAGHGIEWQRAAILVGAKPYAYLTPDIGVSVSDIATPTHHMVDTTTGRVIQKYYRKPPAKVYSKLSTYYVRGRKAETIGKLVIEDVLLMTL